MNILKNNLAKIAILVLLVSLSFSVASTVGGAETIIDKLGTSIEKIDLVSADSIDKADEKVQGIIGKIIGAFLSFLGVIFMLLLLYGGFRWMNARGSEEETKKAKDIILQAVIGLAIVMSAYAISYFISVVVSGF